MAKIISLQEITSIINSFQKNNSIVLVGGCFDILHIGHIIFLKEAKKMGNLLLVLLESDEKVKKLKGSNRPYFPQKDRAEVLASINAVDYVILLPPLDIDEDYNNLILQIKPKIIAVTANDRLISKKEKQAKMVGGEIRIIPYLATLSSSRLARLLGID